MKAFYTTLCLFIIMIAAVAYNCAYITRLSEELIRDAEAVEWDGGDGLSVQQATDLHQKWESNRKFAEVTVNHTEIEAISNNADEFWVLTRLGNQADFEKAKQLLINSFEELRSSERLPSFKSP